MGGEKNKQHHKKGRTNAASKSLAITDATNKGAANKGTASKGALIINFIGVIFISLLFAWFALRSPIFHNTVINIVLYEVVFFTSTLAMVYIPRFVHRRLPQEMLYFPDGRKKRTRFITPAITFCVVFSFIVMSFNYAQSLADKLPKTQALL